MNELVSATCVIFNTERVIIYSNNYINFMTIDAYLFELHCKEKICKLTKLIIGNWDSQKFLCYGNSRNSGNRIVYMAFCCYRCIKNSNKEGLHTSTLRQI